MKNKVLKLSSLIILFIVLLIPSSAFAASQQYWKKSTSTYSNAATSGTYYLGPSSTSYYNRFYNTFIHQITDGSNKYLSYCLDANWGSPQNGSGSITDLSTTELKDKNGNTLSGSRLELLKNIMAAGKQQGTYISGEQFYQSASNSEFKNYLVTQILIWEVMEGGRTDYTPSNINVNGRGKSTYDFVKTDSQMKSYYESILKNAYELSDSGKPSAFGKTYTLKWNDSQNKYISSAINVGSYKYDQSNNSVSVSTLDNSNITISSNNEITSEIRLNFNFKYGMTLDQKFSWFRFGSGSQNQRMLLAYYQGSNSADLSVKTEVGSFKINKKDLSTREYIKGAIFDMYKCDSSNICNTKVATIDMTDKEISDSIVIKKSGKYKIVERVAPKGYDKVPDFIVNLDILDDGNVKITINEENSSFLGVVSANSERGAHLFVYDSSKNFTISKISGNDNKTKINGAQFQIKKSDGTVVKFKKISEGTYQYSEDGTEMDLVSSNMSTYTIIALPIGEYTLEEINVPKPYILSSNSADRQTKFKIDEFDYLQVLNSSNRYVKAVNANITVKNYKSRVTINKTGSDGNVVEGVVFELYDSNKQNQILLNYSNGEYSYGESGSLTQLVTNENGKIIINSLPEGTYYLKEIQTPDPNFIIDETNEWTELEVRLNEDSGNILKTIFNSKKSFCFYKIDENGNYLDKGKFKLQVYNENTSKFEDAPLVQTQDKKFKIDNDAEDSTYIFSPVSGGQTCFVDLNIKSRYKVVEIEAPEGFVLPNNKSDIETEISINEYGYASGDAVIINKRITVGGDAQAQAELIIGISTGMNKINYVFIIGGIILLIIVLIFIRRKMDKK